MSIFGLLCPEVKVFVFKKRVAKYMSIFGFLCPEVRVCVKSYPQKKDLHSTMQDHEN
jgi:hypothetical protein